MSVSLNLSKDTLKLELNKKGVSKIPKCQVSFQLDVSGSFHRSHANGSTNKLLQRVLPFALLLDKDEKLDMFCFSSESLKLEPVTKDNYLNYVKNHVMVSENYNGYSTQYIKGLKSIVENGFDEVVVREKQKGLISKMFGLTKESKEKVSIGKQLSFFVTDGLDSGNTYETLKYFQENKSEDLFVVFISIYESEIDVLKKNYGGKENSEYFNLTLDQLFDLNSKTDDELFDMFLTENLIKWANK